MSPTDRTDQLYSSGESQALDGLQLEPLPSTLK
jgi:hypothetical protein